MAGEHLITTNLPPLQGRSSPSATVYYDLDPQEKKHVRKDLSVRYASEQLGFLHASLIEIGRKHYLLAGPSGIGKSSYASLLEQDMGARKLVSDWIAAEMNGGVLMVSDLNYPEAIKNERGCILSGLIFLSRHDDWQRDAYVPNEQEFSRLLAEVFEGVTAAELQTLSTFWLKHRQGLPFYCAIPVRQASETYTAATIERVLRREITADIPLQVGVIGLGAVGASLTFQLGLLPEVATVYLYNRTPDKTHGLAIDMNQAVVNRGFTPTFIPCDNPVDVFTHSRCVFMTYRDETAVTDQSLPERWRKAGTHIRIAGQYSQIASDANFDGTVMVITNPVDFLTYSFYKQSQDTTYPLRTFQTYGIGLELDWLRAIYFAREAGVTIDGQTFSIYGNHGENIMVHTGLGDVTDAVLNFRIKNGSSEIRHYVPRTIYGPTEAAIRNFLAFVYGQETHLTVLQEGAYIGRRIGFSHRLPQLPGEKTDEKYLQILLDNKNHIGNIIN